MDHFYLKNKTWDSSNISSSDPRNKTSDSVDAAFSYVRLSFVCFGLVVTLTAMFAVFSLVKKDHAAPVFIINLLISDLVQLCCNIKGLTHGWDPVSCSLYFYGVSASVGFMMCVSMERYLVIAKPLWYRFSRNIKASLMICALVWTAAFLFILPLIMFLVFNLVDVERVDILIPCVLLLPLPFFVFFLVGTIRALSAAISVPAVEKRRIVAILVLILLVYVLLFLPFIICCLLPKYRLNDIFSRSSVVLLSISPLADSSLYILLRKGAIDKLFASLCCCKVPNNQQRSSRPDDTPSAPCTETVQIRT